MAKAFTFLLRDLGRARSCCYFDFAAGYFGFVARRTWSAAQVAPRDLPIPAVL
jgi:hypothetical protein